ncbi:VOC family protein [Streptomyces sp. NPDC003015]
MCPAPSTCRRRGSPRTRSLRHRAPRRRAVAQGARLAARGSRLAEYQPQGDVRVLFDPAGHPFCLWVDSAA